MSARRRKSRSRLTIVFAAMALLIAVIIYLATRNSATETMVEYGAVGDARSIDAVVMRNEQLVSSDGYARISYVAEEGTTLRQGETVAYVYAAGYSEKEMDKLEQARREIRDYYTGTLASILDEHLASLNLVVDNYAAQLRTLVRGEDSGNMLTVQRQLEDAMSARQEYLRTNKRDDSMLSGLYDKETQLMNSIMSWRSECTAPIEGTVSFYLDGYESLLNPSNYDGITMDQIRGVLAGQTITTDATRGKTPLFRVVQRDSWSVILLTDSDWSPTLGQSYSLQLKGREDYIYQATVSDMQRNGNTTMVRMDVNQDAEPVMHVRTGTAIVGSQMTGLRVPRRAVFTEGGMYGLRVINAAGGYDFVPVNVTVTDNTYALIEGAAEGAIYAGQRVMLG